VYRFNVTAVNIGTAPAVHIVGDLQGIAEKFQVENAGPVDYFYRIGSIDEVLQGNVIYNMPYDLVGRKSSYGSNASDFVSAISAVPTSTQISDALKAAAAVAAPGGANNDAGAINITGATFTATPSLDGVQVRDTASGAVYVPGQFGVLVNE
jgi:hypothetical protein